MILSRKRFALAALIVVALAVQFWGGSRYPSLNQKALMAGDTLVESPLSFNAVIDLQGGDSFSQKVYVTFVNWALENRVGMTFGICFGAGFMTLFQLLSRRGTNNGLLNTLIGVGTGTPLGVCVNCSAPIARGMHAAGARLETTLAAMFSSPTLNIVVLTMVFSMFPVYMAVIKVGLTLAFILVAVPLLSRFAFPSVRLPTYDDAICEITSPSIQGGEPESWLSAIGGVLRSYAGNLWFIVVRTLPLMLVAGVLGAFAVQMLPLENLAGLENGFVLGLMAAAIGIFLPMPIAFDIVVAAILFSSGLSAFYSMILLFTLGIYSIYPFLIVWNSISKSLAIALMVTLIAFGFAAGYIADYFNQQEIANFYEFLDEN